MSEEKYTNRQYYRDKLGEIPDRDLLGVDPYSTKLFFQLLLDLVWDILNNRLDKGLNEK